MFNPNSEVCSGRLCH